MYWLTQVLGVCWVTRTGGTATGCITEVSENNIFIVKFKLVNLNSLSSLLLDLCGKRRGLV